MELRELRENRNLWLLTCFTIYAIFFFIFAGIYYSIFRANPRNFLFNSDITRSQALPLTIPIEQEIAKLQVDLDAHKVLSKTAFGLRELPNETELEFTIYVNDFEIKTILAKDKFDSKEVNFSIKGQDKNHILDSVDLMEVAKRVVGPRGLEKARDYVIERAVKLEELINERQARLKELQGPTSQVWSYWDFFYFSVITQSTVGYGDILPNSTLVRMVVSAQLIIGLMILTILISLSFRRRKPVSPPPVASHQPPESQQDEIK